VAVVRDNAAFEKTAAMLKVLGAAEVRVFVCACVRASYQISRLLNMLIITFD
jgi:hypothetical protein